MAVRSVSSELSWQPLLGISRVELQKTPFQLFGMGQDHIPTFSSQPQETGRSLLSGHCPYAHSGSLEVKVSQAAESVLL